MLKRASGWTPCVQGSFELHVCIYTMTFYERRDLILCLPIYGYSCRASDQKWLKLRQSHQFDTSKEIRHARRSGTACGFLSKREIKLLNGRRDCNRRRTYSHCSISQIKRTFSMDSNSRCLPKPFRLGSFGYSNRRFKPNDQKSKHHHHTTYVYYGVRNMNPPCNYLSALLN